MNSYGDNNFTKKGTLQTPIVHKTRGTRPILTNSASTSIGTWKGGITSHTSAPNSSDNIPDSSSSELSQQIILCICFSGTKLGASYYDVDTGNLFFLNDCHDIAPDYILLTKLLQQVNPSIILTSSRTDTSIVTKLKLWLTSANLPADNLYLLQTVDFLYDMCKRRVIALKIPNESSNQTEESHYIYIASLINLDEETMIRSTGALLKFIEKRRIGFELETVTNMRVPVMSISSISLADLVLINGNSYSGLNIFSKDFHPSTYKAGYKEGFSLYGIMNRCKTFAGSNLLRLLFLRPTSDRDVLENRLNTIEFLLKPDTIEVVTSLTDCLRKIKNVAIIIKKLNGSPLSTKDWKNLYQSIHNSIKIAEISSRQPPSINIFSDIASCLDPKLYRVAHFMMRTIDFDTGSVNHGVDDALDELKRKFNGLPDLMLKVANEEVKDLPPPMEECTVSYMPQIGYILGVSKWKNNLLEAEMIVQGLQFIFHTAEFIYYKSPRCKELDEVIGDIWVDINNIETSIIERLTNVILDHSQQILGLIKKITFLDCMIAMASVAGESGYVRPEITNSKVIKIKGGRHPLHELCVDTFVPNDCANGEKFGHVKIITSPNSSGKSVYLKQIALIVYMAHIGSFVPADSAHIGTVNAILTRIQTRESLGSNLSTFMIDVNQMADILHSCTGDSLVIIDEFGKGTCENNGLALLASCIKFIISNFSKPHVFVSTHYHRLFEVIPPSSDIIYQTMDFLKGEETVYLYKLVDGVNRNSFALEVASAASIPAVLIKRIAFIQQAMKHGYPIKPLVGGEQQKNVDKHKLIADNFRKQDFDSIDIQEYLKNVLTNLTH